MLLVLLHQPSFLPAGHHQPSSGSVSGSGCGSGAASYTAAAVCRRRRSRIPKAAAEELPGLTFEDIATWVQEAGGEDLTLTYGEITPDGFRTLAQRLRLGASDVFADLGSGHGKAVVQAVAEMGVRAGVGVEIAPPRHERAVALRATLPAAEAERLTFTLGDCADSATWTTRPLAEATVVYVASLLFDKPLLERVAARLAAAPQLRTVATPRRFPSGPNPNPNPSPNPGPRPRPRLSPCLSLALTLTLTLPRWRPCAASPPACVALTNLSRADPCTTSGTFAPARLPQRSLRPHGAAPAPLVSPWLRQRPATTHSSSDAPPPCRHARLPLSRCRHLHCHPSCHTRRVPPPHLPSGQVRAVRDVMDREAPRAGRAGRPASGQPRPHLHPQGAAAECG